MKTVTATLCVCFVLNLALAANAQEKKEQATASKIMAGSAEDRAFMAVKADTNPDSKAVKALEFEKNFPQSPGLPFVYTALVNIYLQKNDAKRMIEYGEKALKSDPKNISALLALSRGHALSEERNLDKAQEFVERAVAVLDELRAKPPQGGYSEKEWKDWLRQNDESVKPWIEYVKALREPPAPTPVAVAN